MYLCRYVPPHRVGFPCRFGLKTGIHFGSGIEYGFRGNYGVYERIYRFNSKWVRKKEKNANSKWIWRIFSLHSNLSKRWRNFCLKAESENGCGKLHFWVWNWVQDLKNRATPPPPGGRGFNNCHFQALDNNIIFASVIVLRYNWQGQKFRSEWMCLRLYEIICKNRRA